jgi:hypothetical protein
MSTVFVTLSDASYFSKAQRTIEELKVNGEWKGDIVLLAVDFIPDPIDGVEIRQVSHLNTDRLFEQWKTYPLTPMDDNRHYGKVYQWDKLQVFSSYFKRWERVVFLDAGIRVFHSVTPLLELEWRGRVLAPDDSDPYDNGNRFGAQLEVSANPPVAELFSREFPKECLSQRYFLNCIFVFDTALIDRLPNLEDMMNRYPIFRCNEMGLMNLVFTVQLGCWTPFLQRVNDKYLFGWCELNYREHPNWRQFHFIKYSVTHP